jgi:hypothetical protein
MPNADLVQQLNRAMQALAAEDPDGWPETVVSVAAGVAGLDVGTMNLLADAATMAAGTAHELAQEAAEEAGDDPTTTTGETRMN